MLHILMMEMVFFSLAKNVETQEQLLNALESLKQHQETINVLKMKAAEEMPKNLHMEDSGRSRDEVEQKVRMMADFPSASARCSRIIHT